MFGWFYKDKNKSEEIQETKKNKYNNYNIDDKGNVVINVVYGKCYKPRFLIPKEFIISHTEESIVSKDCVSTYNHQKTWGYDYYYIDYTKTMENKENFIQYKKTQIKTFKYLSDMKQWNLAKTETVGVEVVSERTPLEVFEEEFKSKYKLIETVDEFNDYLSSTLDCNTWCRKKLYDKMKELGLGDGFINSFADLVGNDSGKYHAMIDLAGEVSDKDTLMYLYTYKFRKDK